MATEKDHGTMSGGWRLPTRQMGAMLLKNVYLKRAEWRQTLAEVGLPGVFMFLLVWIKSLTSVFDSPTAAYVCGQAMPWSHEESLPLNPEELMNSTLLRCLRKPPTCTADHYYRDVGGIFKDVGLEGLYTTVGYMSNGEGYPWYGLTVGDDTTISEDIRVLTGLPSYNPSLSLRHMARRLLKVGEKALIAVAPATIDNPGDAAAAEAAEEFGAWLVDELGGPHSYLSRTVEVFPSEEALVDYIKSSEYEDTRAIHHDHDFSAAEASSMPTDHQGRVQLEEMDEDTAEVLDDRWSGKVGMAVIFNKVPVEGGSQVWDYTLRFNYTYGISQYADQAACLYPGCRMNYQLPSTLVTTASLERPPESGHLFGYSYSGFLTLQKTVDEYILSSAAGQRVYLNVSMGFFPEKSYKTDEFQDVISQTLGIFYMLAFLYPVSRAIRSLVGEKEGRMKEALKMMGLPDYIYHASWFVTFQTQWLVTEILILVVVRNSVFRYSNKILVFMWLEAVALSLMGFCFLISTFFSKSKTAATLGSILYFGAFFPYYLVGGDAKSKVASKTWACLLAPTCLALGTDTFSAFEGGLVGIQVSNARQSYESRLPYVTMLSMLLLDALMYFSVAWYLDKVIPSEFGTPRPWHFLVSDPLKLLGERFLARNKSPRARRDTSFGRRWSWSWITQAWPGAKARGNGHEESSVDDDDDLHALFLGGSPRPGRLSKQELSVPEEMEVDNEEGVTEVESVGPQLSRQVTEGRTISTRGLRKVYPNGKVAVKGLDLDLFEGHISVLLGHNGAGKSTAISMITGTLPPTAGEAYVRGRRLSRDLVGIRQSLGVCFQQNTLFEPLTVTQHLELFAVVKGVPSKEVKSQAARMVAEVGLLEKRHTPASALSGGQKRKLSVAIAFVGGSEVVVLDEPTSGMDPFSRRATWSVLQRQRKGRVILLTTHFMDEADTLGDRIAIMAEGQLRCLGSSLFLKGLYGVGYTLTVMSNDEIAKKADFLADQPENVLENPMAAVEIQDDSLHRLISNYVPEAVLVSNVGKEQNYRLPFASAGKFVGMFTEMDGRRKELGIAGYGISVTTLEEVFLRVGHGTDELLRSANAQGPTIGRIQGTKSRASRTVRNISSGEGSTTSASEGESSLSLSSRLHGGGGDSSRHAGGALGAGGEEHKEDSIGASTVTEGLLGNIRGKTSDGGVERQAAGDMFWVHFRALLLKRLIYGMRDMRGLFFQLVVPGLLFLLGLIQIRASRSFFNQKSLEMLPSKHFNKGLSAARRNPVPIIAPEEDGLASAIADRFDGVSVEGMGIRARGEALDDHFAGCAQGAAPLVDMSNFLLEPHGEEEKGASRYGAVILHNSSHLSSISQWDGGDDDSTSSLVYGLLINASAVHGAPVFMNLVNSAALQVIEAAVEEEKHVSRPTAPIGIETDGHGTRGNHGKVETRELPSITVRSNPLPRTKKEVEAREQIEGFTTALMVVISVCFLPASYAIYVVRERAMKAKHQQIISGVGISAYWISTYVFDVVTYIIPFSVFLGLIYIFDVPSYTQSTGAIVTALLFLLYGPAVAPFTYCISFLFNTASSAQNMVLFINFVTGLALMVVSLVLNILHSTRDVNSKLKWIYRFFPGFCLGDGLAQVVVCRDGKNCMDLSTVGIDDPKELTPFSWEIAGADLLCLVGCSIGYLALCLFIEYLSSFPKVRAMMSPDPKVPVLEEEDDEDVAEEAARVEAMFDEHHDSGEGEVILRGLRKVYRTKQGPKVAVKKLSFAVARGDCFGFLGINGAGKSTTLGILSGDIFPTSGAAKIVGNDILTEQSKLRRFIGYCPQEDALFDLITVEEHLRFYARIKGVDRSLVAKVASSAMDEMSLRPFRSTKAYELSGGNKRKLSVAIAMIGSPRVVFLDEPSTGMDPIARRFMWDIISRITTRAGECSVILTTHSMEEAESLCNKIGIMVNGRLRCLGSTQHLKQRFGRGFEADIKLQPPLDDDVSAALRVIQENEPEGVIGQSLERARLSPPLEAYCRVLTKKSGDTRAGQIIEALDGGSGAFLQDAIFSEGGTLPARLFIEWYLCEERAAGLDAFLGKLFPGTEILERPTLYSFRYKIAHQEGMTLADVFGHFEEAKTQLHLASYAVGQTTLEQIFNDFAAGRDNPEVELATSE